MRRLIAAVLFLALLSQLGSPAFANVQNPQWVPQQPTTSTQSYLWNYRQFFPGGLIENVPPTVNILKLSGSISGPTCQNPGFLFRFQDYVAQLSQIKAYVLSEVQSAMQAAPLLLIEALFPELADILKHLNNMTWLQLSLQHHTCQSMMETVRQSNLVPSLRPYTQCLAQCMGPNGGSSCSGSNETRDQAESDCSATAGLVFDFLNQANVPRLDYMSTLIAWAQGQRNNNGNAEVPNDATLAVIQQLMGEISYSADGRNFTPGIPVRQVYKTYKLAIKTALNALLAECVAQRATQDDCYLSANDWGTYQQYLTVQYPYADTPTTLFDQNVIRAVASQPTANQADSLDMVAHAYAMAELRAIVKGATYVAQLPFGQDGGDEYYPTLSTIILHITEQLDEIESDQQERERVNHTNAKLIELITQARALQLQEQVLPGKPVKAPAFPGTN